jgi:hypothetical protein
MKRRAAAVLCGFLLAFGLAGVTQAASYDVGAHLHVAVLNHPADGHPIARAPYTFHLVLQTHDQIGTTGYLRIDDSSTTRAKVTVKIGPADTVLPLDWTVDFSGWSSGSHEIRWHLDISHNSQGNRQFTTSRTTICIVTCSGGSGRWPAGGGSWYTGPGYMAAVTTSPIAAWHPGGSVTVFSQYSRATSLVVLLNPDLHAGILGTQLAAFGGGAARRTLSLAGLAVGDNIVVISSDGHEAAVLHLRLTDGSPAATFYFEIQSWWSKAGLVLP